MCCVNTANLRVARTDRSQWQAVTVQVGGFQNGIQPSAQWTTVDMYPGGFWDTYALSSDLCSGSSSDCGIGGTWDPGNEQTQDKEQIDFEPSIDDSASGTYMTGLVYAENLNVGGSLAQSYTTPNASMVAVNVGNRTLPNGNEVALEVGQFCLGADEPTQVFSTGSDSTSDPGIETWNVPGYLYNSSQTKANSYAITVGSTRFNYPGSLIFGGYDKGRVIGPPTTWGDTPPQLLDMVLGVEVGGSPFDFESKAGLLLTNTSQNEQIPVFPEPAEPYLHLPKQTCDNLAKYLPITYDSSSGYYLWNTDDPSYMNVTTSAAYLGFVFPPNTGATQDVTIKVPFALLVLNLTQEASGKPGSTPYFPCMPYTPPASGPGAGGSGDNSYLLGRAFLQAAFVGRNWNQHVSWLAQAPGPGSAKQGLGFEPQDIENTATTLDLYEGDKYFNASWSGYWKPLPSGTSAESSTGSTGSGGSGGSSGLSTGAKAGIGIGAAAVGVALLAVAAFFITRRRKDHKGSETQPFVAAAHYGDEGKTISNASPSYQDSDQSTAYGSYQGQYQPSGMASEAYTPYKPGHQEQPIPLSELHGRELRQPATELPAGHNPSELEAGKAN